MQKITLSHSLVYRMTLFAVVFVLLGTSARYFALVNFVQSDLTKVVSVQLEALSRDMALAVDYKISERQRMLQQLAATLPRALLNHPRQARDWLKERYELHPVFTHGLFLIKPDGTSPSDYPERPERRQVSYADRDYFRGALSGQFTIGRPIVGRVVKEPLLPMATPIHDANGRVLAVLAGVTGLNAPGFLDAIHHGFIGEKGGYLLVSPKDEIFLAATRADLILKPTARPGSNPLHDKAMAGFRGSGITTNAQGEEEIAGIASVPSTGWFVVARLPTREGLALVEHTKSFIVQFTPISLGILVLVLFFVLRYYFRPLVFAADQANRMTSDELPLQPLPIHRADEVGFLIHAFNRLLEKLAVSQVALKSLARRDVLTGLPNRLELTERMHQVLHRAQRQRDLFAVLFLDLDNFKPINDRLGHQAGDSALIEVARRLSAVIREVDTLARVGGDEFIIVIGDLGPDLANAQSAASTVAEKCLAAIQAPLSLGEASQVLGVSIGIAIGDAASDIDQIMSAADNAMYDAKRAGRSRYVVA